ncbi:thiolase family protein [Nocardioides sp. BP30]|uniref:thiolase family protein n=1 Tax=Nocardioides sp. BP30 TaxID=3036374 RepID=UPI00246858A7|nr:thiolase family protein [Nocardioides sp. BP30]WGL53990.1 thiolase family protein [Nocardioides sp. BP30]
MSDALIVSAVRTPIATSFKGTLRDTPAEELATLVVGEALARSGVDPGLVDDVILAESQYGGGDLARYAAVAAGLTGVPGQAVNRHCAGSLTAVGNAAAGIIAGMERAVIAGGAHSFSMAPQQSWRVPGREEPRVGMAPTFPYDDRATDDVTISVGWNTCLEVGLSRDDLDRWALRSHERAIAAIDAGVFDEEIVPVKITQADGAVEEFAVDEHPRRGSTLEKLGSLKPLHPEIEGFSITAGNASGMNDAAAALMLVSSELADDQGLTPIARVRAWGAIGVAPYRTGMAGVEAIPLVLRRAGLTVSDVDLWEINEAFAPVPIAACRILGIAEERVNVFGSGCSLGHPIAASGARMLTTLAHELRRRGGGVAVASMCAAGGQGGAVVIEAV